MWPKANCCVTVKGQSKTKVIFVRGTSSVGPRSPDFNASPCSVNKTHRPARKRSLKRECDIA